jgi:hypothetical protein
MEGGRPKTFGKVGQRYKLFWQGCKEGVAGIGVMVAERWIEKVIEVRRVSERVARVHCISLVDVFIFE